MLFDENGKPFDYSFLEINPSFERLTGVSAAEALRGKTIRKVVLLFNNITESKIVEKSLRESEERYRALIEATAPTVWHVTPEGALSFVGDVWTEVSGQSVEEILKWGWLEALHPDDKESNRNFSRTFLTDFVNRTARQLAVKVVWA